MANNNSTTFIYGLVDPLTNQLRYIGKSDNPRARYRKHVTDKSGSHKSNWIQQLRKNGLLPWMIIIDIVPSDGWQRYEYDLIGCGYKHLTNIAEGGIGAIPSDETREKMRIARIGVVPHNKGQKTPLEIRQKQSVSAKLRYERMTDAERETYVKKMHDNRLPDSYRPPGWNHTPEAKAKISNAQKGNKRTASLTREQVMEIVRLIGLRTMPMKDIALMFNVSSSIVSGIKYGRTYVDWTGIDGSTLNGYEELGKMYSQLTDEQVIEIRRLANQGILRQREIALLYGIPASTVSMIKSGKRYKHVKRPED